MNLVSGILGERCHTRFRAIFADINPLNAEINSVRHLLVLLGAHPILHISRIRVKEVKTTNLKGSAKREDESSRHPPYSPDLAPSDFHLFEHCFGRFPASPCVLVRAECE
jgi:hypothetical protein